MCLVTQSCPTLWDPMDCSPPGSSVHGDSPGKNTLVVCHAFFQGIFPSQGPNPGLLHCRWTLYCLSHPTILLLGMYPREMITYVHFNTHTHVHSSIFISAKMWKQHPSADEWAKCGVSTQCNIIWWWKGMKSEACFHMDEPWKHCAKRKKLVTEDHILYDSIYMKHPT